AVRVGDYDLSRYLYIYTDGTPTGAIADWLDWILTADAGQEVAIGIGFYALSDNIIAEEKAKLG
ncbi:MAG: hypothetical protein MIO90_01930, partial [Methanomassiliicoccales archaeon]|nr:hypothetical protein [Methanomassiliicoccales archaeon]